MPLEKSPARQHPATTADIANALGKLYARLARPRDASGSAGMKGRAYVMRVDNRAKVTYAAATPTVRKAPGARQHPATLVGNANTLG
jgi:hypothetical protein